MKVSRRTILKVTGFSLVAINFLPRMAFAARGKLKSFRTGLQPGNKTRLVIETTTRPSYNLSYSDKKLDITFSNTVSDPSIKPSLAAGTLVKSLTQTQVGDKLKITANLNSSI